MQIHNRIFSDKYLDAKVAGLEIPEFDKKIALIAEWQKGIVSGRVIRSKEEQLQSDFLQRFFGDILEYGYSKGLQQWNLDEEQKTLIDASKMDGALGFFSIDDAGNIISDIRVVIELKDARTDLDSPQHRKNDKRSPVQQAFDYANAVGGTCRWVIVSDFVEIRLYFQNDRSRYECFDIQTLHFPHIFRRFWLLFHKHRLIAEKGESFSDKLYYERQEIEATISKKFYNDYKQIRLDLFHHLKKENPDFDELTLLSKTQKLLDRVLFVCFCEDVGIMPPYTLRELIKSAKSDRFIRSDTKIYARLKGLFDAVNNGYPEENINKFNGGLFADDEILDKLIIKDSAIKEVVLIEQYDFASELNVNILGHIFEQSVSDIEELKAEIAGQPFDKKNGKRKKQGIYYTPEYITRYIVGQAVGGWLENQKTTLGLSSLPELSEEDYQSIKPVKKRLKTNEKVGMHIQAYEAYREKLRNIRVLDPACGSGAFLNQAFDFLYKEGQKVNQILAKLKAGQHEVADLDKDILINNIFGVDLNIESVEITKLSLWLKTANQSKELTTLDNNIKSGHSLIDDPAVAGERAFDWHKEFPEIMANGGFDVVVGNPPYVPSHSISDTYKQFYNENYETAEYQMNTFSLFIERSIKLLCERGIYSLIVPNYWLSTRYDEKLRKFVFIRHHAFEVLNVFNVFEEASVDTLIITGRKAEILNLSHKTYVRSLNPNIKTISERLSSLHKKESFFEDIVYFDSECSNTKISFDKNINLKGKYCLADFFKFKQGMKPYEEGKGEPPQTREMMINRIYHARSKKDDSYLPLLGAKNIKRYSFTWENDWIKYGEHLAESRPFELFSIRRLLISRIISGEKIKGTFLSDIFINNTDLINILPKNETVNIKAFAAIILSKLCTSFLKKQNVNLNRKTFPKINVETLKSFPIPELNDIQLDELADKADIMLSQNKVFWALKSDFLNFVKNELTPQKISTKLENWHDLDWDGFKTELAKGKVKLDNLSLKDRKEWQDYFFEHQAKALDIKAIIDKTDSEIDRIVYALYGLTEDEIRIVEP
jgi:type I restriction-modification system DNA methylase subunit